jgi:L-histidine N-alpha-methyltransferase
MDLGIAPFEAEDGAPRGHPNAVTEFAEAVLAGLKRRPRSIPSRFFYDEVGCALFEEITALPEYYLTRVETALLQKHGAEIAALTAESGVLVEFGSGSSRKTDLLLSAHRTISAYIPIDIAGDGLIEAAGRLKQQHPALTIVPLIADFGRRIELPDAGDSRRRLGFFSGSTIGNLTKEEATAFLVNAAQLLGPDAAFLIGVDLKKPLSILLPAYNDAQGITAAFNLNLLARINRELGSTFDLSRFAHEAMWNDGKGRVEMYLTSLADQVVCIGARRIFLRSDERIHTENSHKYTVAEFQRLARDAGWNPIEAWTDADRLFSLHLLAT